MKLAPRSFVARPLLLASLLVSTLALAAVCPGMPPSQVQPACQAKATGISQQAYTTVYNSVMQSCGPSGDPNCAYYANREATKVRDQVYASQYNQCMSSGGPC
ncbi:MAG TPA: hypothetical protein VIN58_16425 [Roseateles sp.]